MIGFIITCFIGVGIYYILKLWFDDPNNRGGGGGNFA